MKFAFLKSAAFAVALTALLPIAISSAQESDADSVAQDSEMHQEGKAHFREMMKERHKHMEKRMGDHLDKLDTNEDGSVDLSEYLTNAEQRFNDMDLDGDQLVTQDEARQAHKQMRTKMRAKHKAHRKHQDTEAEPEEDAE